MASLRFRIIALVALALLAAAGGPPRALAGEPGVTTRRIPAVVRGPLVYDREARLFYGFGIERDSAGDLVRVAFEVDPQTLRYRRIYVFEPGEYLGATLAPDGSLFGTRYAFRGAVFRLVRAGPAEWRYETVHEFTNEEGSFASGQLSFTASGDVGYGRTECGTGPGACMGIVYRIRKRRSGWSLAVIYRFSDAVSGHVSEGPMALLDGELFATTATGGPQKRSAGAAFKLTPGPDPDKPWTFTALRRFVFGDEGHLTRVVGPRGLTAHDGFLYGVADGGDGSGGVVYRVGKTGEGFAVIKHFFGASPDDPGRPPEGSRPLAELAIGRDGAILGATALGGDAACGRTEGCGTLFALRPRGQGRKFAFETLHMFAGRSVDGETPETGPTRVGGSLYGLVARGRRGGAEGVYRFVGD